VADDRSVLKQRFERFFVSVCAARIESICRQLGRPLLMSSDFIEAANISAQSLGAFH